ncbi:hypothetical protein OSTOST_02314, partial [Ostertagia ostertagi]
LWDEKYADWALVDAVKRGGGFVPVKEAGWLEIRKQSVFRANDTRSLEEKVNSTLEACFKEEGEKVKSTS